MFVAVYLGLHTNGQDEHGVGVAEVHVGDDRQIDKVCFFGDDETQDMVIARIQVHQKTLWMLKSYLG